MQNQLLKDDDCACFLVEAIAKRSQNIKWETTVDGTPVSHKLIRRVSIDAFYSLITKDDTAFYKLCMTLPSVIQKVVDNEGAALVPHDTVFEELQQKAYETGISSNDLAIAMSIYLLGFSTYKGFKT